MKLAVRIDTVAALKAGKKNAGAAVIDLDPAELTQEERDILAAKVWTTTSGSGFDRVTADVYLVNGPGGTLLIEPTLDDLRRVLAESIAYRNAELAAKEENAKARAERDAKKAAELLATPVADLIHKGYGKRPYGVAYALNSEAMEELNDLKARVGAECNRLNDEYEAAEAAALAEREAAKAAGVRDLAAWADAHGSELCRARKAGGFEWVGLAEREYAEHVVAPLAHLGDAGIPDGYEPVKEEPRQHPTLTEIRALEEARKAVGDRATVSLLWMKYSPDGSDDDVTEPINRAEIRVTVKCPTGRELDCDFLPPNE